MGLHVLITMILLTLISGCASSKGAAQTIYKSRPALMDVYAKSVGQSKKDMQVFVNQKLQEQEVYGYVKPYLPVVQQAVVRKVWVPDHKSQEDADILVAGHWAYVMVQGPRWFIDTEGADEEQGHDVVPMPPSSKKKLEGSEGL